VRVQGHFGREQDDAGRDDDHACHDAIAIRAISNRIIPGWAVLRVDWDVDVVPGCRLRALAANIIGPGRYVGEGRGVFKLQQFVDLPRRLWFEILLTDLRSDVMTFDAPGKGKRG
jgi:hypothetical protein